MHRNFGSKGSKQTREQIRAQIELEFPDVPAETKERIEILRYLMQDEDDLQKKAAIALELSDLESGLRSTKTRLDIHFEGLVSQARSAWNEALQKSSEKVLHEMEQSLAKRLPGATREELKQLAVCMLKVKSGKAKKEEFSKLGDEIKNAISARLKKLREKKEREEKLAAVAAAAVDDEVSKEKVEEMICFLEESGTTNMQIIERVASVFKIDEKNFGHENLKNVIDVLSDRLGRDDDYREMDKAGLIDCLRLLIT